MKISIEKGDRIELISQYSPVTFQVINVSGGRAKLFNLSSHEKEILKFRDSSFEDEQDVESDNAFHQSVKLHAKVEYAIDRFCRELDVNRNHVDVSMNSNKFEILLRVFLEVENNIQLKEKEINLHGAIVKSVDWIGISNILVKSENASRFIDIENSKIIKEWNDPQ